MNQPTIYEIDTGELHRTLRKGETIAKMVLLEDYNKVVTKLKKEFIEDLECIKKTLTGTKWDKECPYYVTQRIEEIKNEVKE